MGGMNPVWRAGVTQDDEPSSKVGLIAGIAGAVILLLVAGGGGYFFLRYGVFTVPSSSMEPTIRNGDTMLCDKWAYDKRSPVKGEVVGLRHNQSITLKRLIGFAGEHVEGRNGKIFVNDVLLTETYAQYKGEMDAPDTFGPVEVPAGQVFVLGDNRNHSQDSRRDDFGSVQTQDIACKAAYVAKSNERQHVGPIR